MFIIVFVAVLLDDGSLTTTTPSPDVHSAQASHLSSEVPTETLLGGFQPSIVAVLGIFFYYRRPLKMQGG